MEILFVAGRRQVQIDNNKKIVMDNRAAAPIKNYTFIFKKKSLSIKK